MVSLPEPIRQLQAALHRLPGIGPRSAERLALHLVQSDKALVQQLADALIHAREHIRACSICGALTESDPCAICNHPQRDHSQVCVVEKPVDIFSIEKACSFTGTYHVLGGRISPLDGVDPDDLRIRELEARLEKESIQEVILALATDVEGDATSMYLGKRLSAQGIKVTRLAHGLPVGSGLEFADEITLSRALSGRRSYED